MLYPVYSRNKTICQQISHTQGEELLNFLLKVEGNHHWQGQAFDSPTPIRYISILVQLSPIIPTALYFLFLFSVEVSEGRFSRGQICGFLCAHVAYGRPAQLDPEF